MKTSRKYLIFAIACIAVTGLFAFVYNNLSDNSQWIPVIGTLVMICILVGLLTCIASLMTSIAEDADENDYPPPV